MARSSVFDAATVMVSSDCTGAPPICARAFSTGAVACTCCGFAGVRLDCFFFCRSEPPAISVSADCAKPKSEKVSPIASTDAPKIKARVPLAPSTITTPT